VELAAISGAAIHAVTGAIAHGLALALARAAFAFAQKLVGSSSQLVMERRISRRTATLLGSLLSRPAVERCQRFPWKTNLHCCAKTVDIPEPMIVPLGSG